MSAPVGRRSRWKHYGCVCVACFFVVLWVAAVHEKDAIHASIDAVGVLVWLIWAEETREVSA